MMMIYLGADLGDAMKKVEDTQRCHARFGFLGRMYARQLIMVEWTVGDNDQVMEHRSYTLKAYLLYLVGTSNFIDKSAYYVDVVYFRYFADLEQIHEYN